VNNNFRGTLQITRKLGLVHGLKSSARVKLNGTIIPLTAPHEFLPERGCAILRISGQATIEVVP
ncbi:MAG: hypothetical protein WCO56_26885, partial [Verrucomicrobiota bacterium]